MELCLKNQKIVYDGGNKKQACFLFNGIAFDGMARKAIAEMEKKKLFG